MLLRKFVKERRTTRNTLFLAPVRQTQKKTLDHAKSSEIHCIAVFHWNIISSGLFGSPEKTKNLLDGAIHWIFDFQQKRDIRSNKSSGLKQKQKKQLNAKRNKKSKNFCYVRRSKKQKSTGLLFPMEFFHPVDDSIQWIFFINYCSDNSIFFSHFRYKDFYRLRVCRRQLPVNLRKMKSFIL